MPRRKRQDFYKVIHDVADNAMPRFRGLYLRGIRDIKKSISLAAIVRALEEGRAVEVADGKPEAVSRRKPTTPKVIQFAVGDDDILSETTPWAEMGLGALAIGAGKNLNGVFSRSGTAQEELINIGIRFDIKNPRAARWATDHAAELVTNIGEGTRDSIRGIIARGVDRGTPLPEIAREIKGAIGLTTRQAEQVDRFTLRLVDKGLSATKITEEVEALRNRLLRQRATTIARDQTILAASAGQEELWMQAGDEGLLSRDKARQVWVVTPDDKVDTVICLPMNGQKVRIGELFVTPQGRRVRASGAHPRCRCVASLELGL